MSKYVPVAEVVPGVEILELPEGYTPLSAVLMVKALDADGKVSWLSRYPKDLHSVECLGALHAGVTCLTADITGAFEPEDNDDAA